MISSPRGIMTYNLSSLPNIVTGLSPCKENRANAGVKISQNLAQVLTDTTFKDIDLTWYMKYNIDVTARQTRPLTKI